MRASSSIRSRCASAALRPLFAALLALAGCHHAPGAGDGCIDDADCAGSLRCYSVTAFGSRRCLAPCDPGAVVLCSEATEGTEGLCAPLDVADAGVAPGGACLLGGEIPLGAECGASIDCVPGGVCVEEGAKGACRAACDTRGGAAFCGMGAACFALGASEDARGYCGDAPDGGA
jgi:hypothetical protein